ncbi:MAG: hypothetical protein AMJ62_01970 [Myxococcales bacterium SG8_38]|nr:MAG: hypothetical protein AMJ62_01970 [Myxococcales bacterium SG8_38]
MTSARPLSFLALTLAFGCSSSSSGYAPSTDTSDLCVTPLAPDEPLCNTGFGDTVWPGSHRGSYAQGSSALPGPTVSEDTTGEHLELQGAGVPVIAAFSAPYEDGGRAIWSTVTGFDAAIVKIDHESFQIVDWYVPAERESNPPTFALGLSGAYTAIDAQNRFIAGRTRFVSFFGDSVEGDRLSPIELKKRIFLPDEVFCGDEDIIAGMSLTFDGHLAFATEFGNLFVIGSDADPEDLGPVPVISANAGCATGDASDAEIVSNSIAVDEDGGIYLLTSAAMYRFDWDGSTLRRAWRAEYESSEEVPSPIRLGPGSGSTPSLMGTRASDDRFVVITDGQALMNLVLFWRDEIPDDWQPIAPDKDPRIACEVPVDFGTGATEAISEQSVAVRGYSAVLVNDLLTNPTINPPSMSALGALAQNLVSALEGGIPEKAPFGVERIDWDPVARTCATVWANTEISIPNGIPAISAASGLVYGAGQRGGQWGLEGLDLETGESRLWSPAGPGTCPGDLAGTASILPGVADVLAVVPDSCENSVYAATTIGPDGKVYQGTLNGMTRYVPETVDAPPSVWQADAGIDQALDLLTRAESLAPSSIAPRDALRRAIAQLDATQELARAAGLDDVAQASAMALEALDDAVEALDAGAPFDLQVQAARDALSSTTR